MTETAAAIQSEPDRARLRRLTLISGLISVPLLVMHVLVVLLVTPDFGSLYRDLGGPLPVLTRLLVEQRGVVALVVVSIDALAFWAGYQIAKRRGSGVVFAPLALYTVMAGVLLVVLYWPMFQVENLIGL